MRGDEETASTPGRRARINDVEGQLLIQLEDESGHALAARNLKPQGSCEALAEAAAVILASWQATLPPAELPAMRARSAATMTASGNRPNPLRVRFDVGAGASLVMGNAGAASGAALEANVSPWRSAWGFHLGGRLTQSRAIDVGGREVGVRRTLVALGPAYIRTWSHWQWASSVGVEVGWFQAEGTGFSQNLAGGRVSPGGYGHTRLAFQFNEHKAVAFGGGVSVSATEHRLLVLGSAVETAQRPADFVFVLSLCFGRFQ
jgi:hypothetical protein